MSDNIAATLQERGSRYGSYEYHARVTQNLKSVMTEFVRADGTAPWDKLEPYHREAIDMILHKLGRIVNGDPDYDDSWRDIAGYAQLVVNIIANKQKEVKP